MNIIRVMVIENSLILREGLIAMIDGQADMKITVAVGSSKNLLKIIHKNNPDLILLDLGLDRHDNLSLIKYVRKAMPETRIIGMDFGSRYTITDEFKKAGVSGFVLKDATDEEFLKTMRLNAKREESLLTIE